MAAVISLKDVIEALEFTTDDATHYLDPDTGEIIMVTEEEREIVEEEDEESWDDLPEWQQEDLPRVRAILKNERALELPSRFDIHEWATMERFAQEQRSERARQGLLHAVHGAGAFRAFKNAIHLLGIEKSWYKFRDEALAQIARDWLEEHKLPYK